MVSQSHSWLYFVKGLRCQLWAKSFEYRQRIKLLEGRRQPISLGISELSFTMCLGQGTHRSPSQPLFPQIPTDSAWGTGGVHNTDYQEDCAVRLKITGPPNRDLVTAVPVTQGVAEGSPSKLYYRSLPNNCRK